ncbi:MAG: ubiquinol-cytochrome c reductase iron-sulfur subunit [Planctomycetota bacterium]
MSRRLEPEAVSRRDFLGLAGLWSAGLAVIGSLLGMIRLPKPRVTPEASSRFRVGKPEEYSPDVPRVIPERKVRILRTEEGFAAMSMVCTHLGCIVKEIPSGFACPCHGSKFGPEGSVLGGPAPAALRWLAVSQAADGALIVDASEQVPSGTFYRPLA